MQNLKKNITINTLALMIKDGFDDVDKKFNDVDERFDDVNERFDDVNKKFDNINKNIQGLGQGQEEIKLKLDNVAYRFELKELEDRIKIIEKQVQQLKFAKS